MSVMSKCPTAPPPPPSNDSRAIQVPPAHLTPLSQLPPAQPKKKKKKRLVTMSSQEDFTAANESRGYAAPVQPPMPISYAGPPSSTRRDPSPSRVRGQSLPNTPAPMYNSTPLYQHSRQPPPDGQNRPVSRGNRMVPSHSENWQRYVNRYSTSVNKVIIIQAFYDFFSKLTEICFQQDCEHCIFDTFFYRTQGDDIEDLSDDDEPSGGGRHDERTAERRGRGPRSSSAGGRGQKYLSPQITSTPHETGKPPQYQQQVVISVESRLLS